MQPAPWTVITALYLLLLGSCPIFAAEPDAAAAPEPSTVSDLDIPVDELALLLKPLTREELLVEAEAWRAVLKRKVEEIAEAELAVKRQNREIEKTQEIQDQAEEAKEALEDVKRQAETARASGDTDALLEVQTHAQEASQKIEQMSRSVEEAAEAAANTADAEARIAPQIRTELDQTTEAADEAQRALEQVEEAAEEVDAMSGVERQAAAAAAQQATDKAEAATREVREEAQDAVTAADVSPRKADLMEQTAAVMEQAEEAKKERKLALLEEVNRLREERTVVIDRLNAVLDELASKTDENDTDTLAKVADFSLYISSVRGLQVDVEDTTSAWMAIKGWLGSEEGGIRWAKNIGQFLGILLGAWILAGILSRIVHRALGVMRNVPRLLEDFLVKIVRWVVIAIGIIMALAAMEVSIGPLLALIGAAGFVIAFAMQDTLGNFASGLMILFFRPFDVGDVVEAAGVAGTVTSMNLVSTTIRTFDNKQMVVPNNKIWHDVITNVTGVDTRRVDMEFGIAYDADVERAHRILDEIVKGHPKVLDEPAPTIRMHTLGDSSVNFICRPWARTTDYWEVYWDITKAVKLQFDAEGIGIPFPQRDVHLYVAERGGEERPESLTTGRGASAVAEAGA